MNNTKVISFQIQLPGLSFWRSSKRVVHNTTVPIVTVPIVTHCDTDRLCHIYATTKLTQDKDPWGIPWPSSVQEAAATKKNSA